MSLVGMPVGCSFVAWRNSQDSGGWTWVWMQGEMVRPEDWIEVVW